MNKSSISLILLIAILLVPIILFVSIMQSQDRQMVESQTNSETQQPQVKIYDVPVSTQEAFLDVLSSEKKPGGIVVVNRNCVAGELKPQAKLEYTSLQAALNSIAKQDPGYSWSIEEGVVNLIPTNDEPDFLKTQIKEFLLDGELNIDLALEKLSRLPDVKGRAREVNLNRGLRYGGLSSPRDTKPRLKFELTNVTFRQALNEIVRKDGRAVWRYYESNCNSKVNSSLELLVH